MPSEARGKPPTVTGSTIDSIAQRMTKSKERLQYLSGNEESYTVNFGDISYTDS